MAAAAVGRDAVLRAISTFEKASLRTTTPKPPPNFCGRDGDGSTKVIKEDPREAILAAVRGFKPGALTPVAAPLTKRAPDARTSLLDELKSFRDNNLKRQQLLRTPAPPPPLSRPALEPRDAVLSSIRLFQCDTLTPSLSPSSAKAQQQQRLLEPRDAVLATVKALGKRKGGATGSLRRCAKPNEERGSGGDAQVLFSPRDHILFKISRFDRSSLKKGVSSSSSSSNSQYRQRNNPDLVSGPKSPRILDMIRSFRRDSLKHTPRLRTGAAKRPRTPPANDIRGQFVAALQRRFERSFSSTTQLNNRHSGVGSSSSRMTSTTSICMDDSWMD